MASKKSKKISDVDTFESGSYQAPDTRYFKSKELFDTAIGQDFILHANQNTARGEKFLVGLSHGQSPAGAYTYILNHYNEIKRPELLRYTFVNSPLQRQRHLKGVMDAKSFLMRLVRERYITKEHILGRTLNRVSLEQYCKDFNAALGNYLTEENKTGMDYVFLASDPSGRVAGIARHSEAFGSKEYAVIVEGRSEQELTGTPHFLMQSKRIAFLATKADKRRPLAWLYYRWGQPDESPSFLRYMDNVKKRMTVFIDDLALTWPQVIVTRPTAHGDSLIRIDLPKPYNEQSKKKLPVVLLIHGFLGLNSYDALLTSIPSHKYLAAAMHYGSVPQSLSPRDYSRHIMLNIDAVVRHFGDKGHDVYIFDHSMGNIYFLMMDREFDSLPGINTYLKGRIGANPFFGEEAKHAMLGFMDNVILPSGQGIIAKTLFIAARNIVPMDSKVGVRNRGIGLSEWLISKETSFRDRVWKAAKERILYLMTTMGSLPHLNRIPIEQALSRLPAKLFAIQTHSALQESKVFDKQVGLTHMTQHHIPILILKSEKDSVAKFVPRLYQGEGIQVMDVTDFDEKDLFREHLFHMMQPLQTANIIDKFISEAELKLAIPAEIQAQN